MGMEETSLMIAGILTHPPNALIVRRRMTRTIDEEIQRVRTAVEKMITAYKAWGPLIKWKASSNVYQDMAEYVNFRIETAESCLLLLENHRVADALGLSRSILEHFMLLRLMCRGTRYYQLQYLEKLKPAEIETFLKERQEELETDHKQGKQPTLLYIDKYPRQNKTLMWIFEGLHNKSDDSVIPIYLFQFKDFDPSTMRLKTEDYFTYYEPAPHIKAARKKWQLESMFNHQHYLSYSALMQCLELNELFTDAELKRLDAHYTFLGTFLHPTHDAARGLHDRGGSWGELMMSGKDQTYTSESVLLATIYVAYLVSSLIDELSGLFDSASTEFITDASTADVKASSQIVRDEFGYFWFIENDVPLFDQFNHAIHHMTAAEISAIGGYKAVRTDSVSFNHHIYTNFGKSLNGWSNRLVGKYPSPLAS
jgi:hypothetical protein